MIDLTKATTVFIGRRGEHKYRKLEFDVSSLLEGTYPETALNAIYKRPDGTAYPVVTGYANGVLTWSPSATDTQFVGVGRLEIRVTHGDVVGKSVRILTIVEEALADGINLPPEPPAQEWLNQVLSALAELDIDELYSLLNLTYNLLNTTNGEVSEISNLLNATNVQVSNISDLLNVTSGHVSDISSQLTATSEQVYDSNELLTTMNDQFVNMNGMLNIINEQVSDMSNMISTRTGILLNHWHPVETASAPDLVSRRASATFSSITPGNNMVLATIIYTFVSALGSPGANNVQVLVQGNIRGTVQKLAEAIRGIQDGANIAYGSGVTSNPTCTAYWTSQRFSIGDTTVVSGESLFLLEKAEDINTALTLTSTAAATINAFTRSSYVRYVLSGNVAGSGGTNSIRGPLHTIIPINSVAIGGQGGQLVPAAYDCHLVTLCRQSDTSEKELDLYISNDEQTFTRISRSTPVGADSSTESQHYQIEMRQSRVPAGYGLYIRMGSNGTSTTAYCDLKFTYHLYPATLATANPFQ